MQPRLLCDLFWKEPDREFCGCFVMGNWRNRPPRRFFNRQRVPKSPPEYEKDPSSSGYFEDGIPLWEKKFCSLIGSVPWQKVVHAKKFMYSNNVLNWDDSAGKEAFHNAKNRFWAEINGFPCDISLPDPDIYVDEINWDPDIDPELIKDLESVYFAPNDGENNGKFGHRNKKSRNLTAVASKSCNGNSEIIDNPWESDNNMQGRDTLKDEAQDREPGDEAVNAEVHGWNQWENNNNNSLNLNHDNNPWDHSFNQCNGALKSNAWGSCGNKSRGWDQGVNHVKQFSNWDNSASSWEHSCQGVYPVTDNKVWDDIGNNSGCWNQHKSWKLNSGDNPLEHCFIQNGGPPKDRGRGDGGGNAWGWKQQDNYRSAPKHSEFGRSGGGWGVQNKGCRKREGSHLTSYKSYGYQQGYKQTGLLFAGKSSHQLTDWGCDCDCRKMPPQPPLKPYFFYGHRKPSQNRPMVFGGLFSNRQSLKKPDPTPHLPSQPFNIQKWDPHYLPSQTHARSPPSMTPLSISERLSPIARFIIDSFRKNQYRWGPEVVTQLQKLRRVTPDLVAEVLKVENNPVLASKFFHWAGKQKGYRHTFSSYNALAYCLHRNKLFRAADQVPELMEAQGRVSEMFEILEKMRGNLCKPDVFAYTAMLRVLVSEGNLDACWRVWEEMRKDLVEPDVMAYVTLITGFCKGGRVERGYELFREMKEKGVLIDRAIYGVLVEGFVGEGKVGKACDMLKDLVDSGYRTDLGIYNSIIGGLCTIKRVDKAYKLFEITVQDGLEPDFLTVNPLLVCYAEMGRMDDFCKLLMQMEKLRFCVVDDLEKFFEFMVGKEERIKMALEVFEELKGKGYGSVSIYNILMGTLHKIGEVKKALSLFGEMKDLNLEPNPSTYSIAIQCFVENGDIQEACTCHNKIIEMSHVPSVGAYSYLAKGLCKIGEIDAAMMLVRDCLGNVTSGPMEFKYALTIIHMCRSGDAEKVIEVLNEMMQEGGALDDVICSAIIYGMCKYGTLEEARKVFTNLGERKLLTEANTIVYDEILIEHMKKKTADLILVGLKFFGLESKLKAKGSRLLSG
ncbi:hypothetical protein Pint_23853 [Pistacia integerrima]|uniref:Uncharacterized protein n=1 Tax=Pistacia integerrima TaxID=434235 RepID=A0ACC0YLC6_9ROSI|nr:hypothetical protein Pint_23853 [Pistacia integerrima]